MKTAFITGITGQDGSYLADLLLTKGYRVIGLARRSTNYVYPNLLGLKGKVDLVYGDLIDAETLGNAIRNYQPDEVYNLAAQSVPADSWNQPIVTAEVTAVGALRLLEAVRKFKPDARFYQATSREIYGGVPQEVIDESSPLLANNPYGIAKLYAHLITQNYRDSYGMFTCAGVLFNHESERRSLHFISRKVTMAVACIYLDTPHVPLNEVGQPLVVNKKLKLGNLDAVRDWGYAKEYVEAIWLMMQQDKPEDYVIATNTLHTVRDLCELAFGAAGLNWQDHVEVDERFLRPTEINAARGDYSKAEAKLGWKPRTSLKELIQLMVDADIRRVSEPKFSGVYT